MKLFVVSKNTPVTIIRERDGATNRKYYTKKRNVFDIEDVIMDEVIATNKNWAIDDSVRQWLVWGQTGFTVFRKGGFIMLVKSKRIEVQQ